MKLLDAWRRMNEGCPECPDKDARIARLEEALRSKALQTYPVIGPDQMRLADRIAFADKDRPWRTVTGTVLKFGWTSSGSFELTLAAGWVWTDRIEPTAERPRGYYSTHSASTDNTFELSGDKVFRLLYRMQLA